MNAPAKNPPAAPETRSVPGARRGPFDPESLVVTSRAVQIGTVWAATVTVTGYPREVFGGWLAPLSTHPAMLDVSLHISPLDPVTAAARLRRRLARLESGRRSGAEHGRLADPMVEAATEDAYELADRVARGEGRLFTVTMTLTVHAPTREQLDAELAALRALTTSLLMVTRATTWRAWHGWISGLPMGIDRIGGGRVMDTAALAAAFPFTSPDLPTPTNPPHHPPTPPTPAERGRRGVCCTGTTWGRSHWCSGTASPPTTTTRSSSAAPDPASPTWPSSSCCARCIGGCTPRSSTPKTNTSASAPRSAPPSSEWVRPGSGSTPLICRSTLDPVTGVRTAAADALARRALFLHTFLSVALHTTPTGGGGPAAGAGLSSTERAVLDTAITLTYRGAGITDDPDTWTRPAPLLADLHATLLTRATARHAAPSDTTGESVAGAAASLATRLRPFVDGAYAGLFDGPTTTPPVGHLVVWSLRHLADELKPAAMLLVLDAIWAAVTHPHDRRRRLITVDEAWLLLAHPAGAQFLLRAAKAGRKHWAGLTVITQDTADVLSTDLGRAVIANAATQILLRQAPQTLDHVATTFGLSAGERGFLQSAERGEGLLTCGEHRAAFSATASQVEDELITTDPRQLAVTTDSGPDWIVLDHPTQPTRPGWVGDRRAARSAAGASDDTQEIW